MPVRCDIEPPSKAKLVSLSKRLKIYLLTELVGSKSGFEEELLVSLQNQNNQEYTQSILCVLISVTLGDSLVKHHLQSSSIVQRFQVQSPVKDQVIPKWYQQFPCLALNIKNDKLTLSQELRQEKYVMDKIWDRNPFKVRGHYWSLWWGEKNRMTTQNR